MELMTLLEISLSTVVQTASLIATIAALCGLLYRWLGSIPLVKWRNRMDSYLELADRLELMGEFDWAREQRRAGWIVMLTWLVRYEYNRNHRWPFVIQVLTVLSGVIVLTIQVMVSQYWDNLGCAFVVFIFLVGIVVSVAHQSWLGRYVGHEVQVRWRRHVAAGDVGRLEYVRKHGIIMNDIALDF